MIVITVKAYASLAKKYPDVAMKQLSVKPGATLREIIGMLNINKEDIGLIVRNNLRVDSEAVLEDGDVLMFFPSIGGG